MWTDFNNSFTAIFSDEPQNRPQYFYHLTSNLLPHYLVKFK